MMLWHAQNVNIDQRMLSLATYVGHSAVTNTYWYLTCVPELMALAGNKFEAFTQTQEKDDYSGPRKLDNRLRYKS
ncbi:MAG: hypothetical protein KZQ69_16880 [gamma proteobacterium symbiont of Bathyaustriella thionipta]|nr:hypothetical protein [gamma proteobacterium symbiont of Bathyaustriella thionipta]